MSGGSLRRVRGALVAGLAVLALSACSIEQGTGPDGSTPSIKVDVSLPDVNVDSGSDSGSSGSSDSGNTDSGDNGSGDNGSGNSSGGDSSGSSGDGGNASTAATSDGMSPLAWAVLAFGVIAAIALIVGGSSSGDRRARDAAHRRDSLRRINGVIQNSRWASSQAATALTIDDSTSLQTAWTQARSYLPDIETTAASLAADERDADLAAAVGRVGQTVATVRGAMDSYVNTRIHHSREGATGRGAEQTVRQALTALDQSVQQLSDLAVSRSTAD